MTAVHTSQVGIKFMMISLLVMVFILSCEKEKYDYPHFESSQSEFTNNELLDATYTSYKFPENFYKEKLGDTGLYYVNTISIDSLADRWIELSTNSSEQARSWSERSSPANSVFATVHQTEKYFEYFRISNPVDRLLIKFRTHKQSYFSRGDHDFFNKSDTIGIFNKPGFTGAEAKELIDYLWFIRQYNNSSSKVLSSFIDENATEILVYHYELNVVYGDFNIKDQITLLESVYEIRKLNGIITFESTEVKTVEGKEG